MMLPPHPLRGNEGIKQQTQSDGHQQCVQDLPMNSHETRRSKTIPLPRSHIPRTQSELQLREDMAAAEWRDLCMFHRLVSGMRARHHAKLAECYERHDAMEGLPRSPVLRTERSLENIIMTRHQRQMVTPYDSSAESSLTDASCHNSFEFRSEQLQNEVENPAGGQYGAFGPQQKDAQSVEGGDWSLTGYEDTIDSAFGESRRYQQPHGFGMFIPPMVIEPDEDHEGDVFSLDL